MSTYDKLIKQATKPKPGAPKPKYIDPIIASSFSQDGSLQDICRALGGRLRDSSSLVRVPLSLFYPAAAGMYAWGWLTLEGFYRSSSRA